MPWKITTNGHHRDVENYPGPDVQAEFDYIDWAAVYRGEESVSLARYRGEWWDLSDCEEDSRVFPEWTGFFSLTMWSAVVFRFVDDWSGVVFGYAEMVDDE